MRPVRFESAEPAGYDVWLVLGYPPAELGRTNSGSYNIRRNIAIYDSDWNEVTRLSHTVEAPAGGDLTSLLVDGLQFSLVPGDYHLGVNIEELNTKKMGAYWLPLDLPPLSPYTLRISDLVIADRLYEGDELSRFSRGGFGIVPSPTGVLPRNRDVSLYFEIYPVAEAIEAPHEVSITVRSRDGSSLPERIFGAVKGMLGRSEDEGAITVRYARHPEGPTLLAETLTLDASALSPGIYEITVEVRHTTSGALVTKKAELLLTDGGQE